jgi:hypothetical protein
MWEQAEAKQPQCEQCANTCNWKSLIPSQDPHNEHLTHKRQTTRQYCSAHQRQSTLGPLAHTHARMRVCDTHSSTHAQVRIAGRHTQKHAGMCARTYTHTHCDDGQTIRDACCQQTKLLSDRSHQVLPAAIKMHLPPIRETCTAPSVPWLSNQLRLWG